MKRIIAAILFFFFLQLGTTPLYAECQAGDYCAPNPACDGVNPLSEVFSPDAGNHILIDNLSGMEVINFDNALSGWTGYQYTYYRYITPCGNIVIMPATFTSIFANLDPSALPPEGWLGITDGFASTAEIIAQMRDMRTPSGHIVGEEIDDLLDACNVLPEQEEQFYEDMLNGQGCAWTIGWNTAGELSNFFIDQFSHPEENPLGILPSAVLVYPASECDRLANFGGCACEQDDPAGPANCPAPTISTQRLIAEVKKVAPVNPVVIGQDLYQRGADVQANVTVPPVIYTWYEEIPHYLEYCKPWRWGDGARDCALHSLDPFYNGVKEWRLDHYECRQHVEVYPDQVVSMSVSTILSTESRAWITQDLGAIWYRASVKKPSFLLIPGYGALSASCDGSQVCRGVGNALRIPFQDPGHYVLQLIGQTSGTPVSAPRGYMAYGDLEMNVILVQETGPWQ